MGKVQFSPEHAAASVVLTIAVVLWALHENPRLTQVMFGEPRVIHVFPATLSGDQ